MLRNNEVFKLNNLLFLTTFTLPMYMLLNNVVLGVFLFCSLIVSILNKTKPKGNFVKQYFPLLLFFILAVIASINNTETFFVKNIERYLSFLLIPFAFWLQDDIDIDKLMKIALRGLTYGCLATLIICYGNVIYEMVVFKEPLSYFLRWRHVSHNFTQIADTHPSYLGLFICTSTYNLLFQDNKINKILKMGFLVLFVLGMFQLLSRVALGVFIFVWGLYFFKKMIKSKKRMVVLVMIVFGITGLFYTYGSSYLKGRIFTAESVKKDSRFDHLEVSYQIFKEHPLIGVGLDKIEEERMRKYKNEGYFVATKHKYNAHNQFVEYLGINGLLGGLVYLGVFNYLTIIAIKRKEYLFLFVIVSFFVANLTESMMVRIKGIEYFALFVSIFLSKQKGLKTKQF